MGWKASDRGVGFYVVKRCGGEVRGKYYLGFRVLVWPLEVQNVPDRGMGQNGENLRNLNDLRAILASSHQPSRV